jgi:hypothetical protein
MRRVFAFVILISLMSIAYSFTVSAYIDEVEYTEKYMALDWEVLGSRNASDKFYELRSEYLTHKYSIQDYGLTFLLLGLGGLFLFKYGKFISTPSTKARISAIGFSAAILTTAAFVGDLFLEFYRGAFPWWADSLGIPLMGVPVMAVIFIAWAALNLLALSGSFTSGAAIDLSDFRGSNYFYLLLILATILVLLLCIVDGFFWLVIPGMLWLYFYMSLWAGRKAANQSFNSDGANYAPPG